VDGTHRRPPLFGELDRRREDFLSDRSELHRHEDAFVDALQRRDKIRLRGHDPPEHALLAGDPGHDVDRCAEEEPERAGDAGGLVGC
jgi:hypothetical protein